MPNMTTEHRVPRIRRLARRIAQLTALRAPLALASLLGTGFVPLTGAAEEVPIVGSEALIGDLISITGDPIEIRSVDLRIEFHRNSAEITEMAEAQLRELGTALTSESLRDAQLALYGHTDSSGPADYNRQLSERRARAVADFLQAHFAIAHERLREVRGYGEERPREDLPADVAAQRRVEIVTFHERAEEESEPDEDSSAEAVPAESEQPITLPDSSSADDPDSGEPAASDDAGQTQGGYIVIE